MVQGVLQAWIRSQTGTTGTFNGDLGAYLVSQGKSLTYGINGALGELLKTRLSLVGNYSLPYLQNAYAASKGLQGWYAVEDLS